MLMLLYELEEALRNGMLVAAGGRGLHPHAFDLDRGSARCRNEHGCVRGWRMARRSKQAVV
jgi:hypothetical protein